MADEFQTNVTDGVLHIAVNIPRLDASTSAALKSRIQPELDSDVQSAEVELGNVQFIDSSGIGFLLGIYRKLPGDASVVILRNVQPGVQAVLELLRLHRVFKVV
jgi:anti-sigma B factor antagonist